MDNPFSFLNLDRLSPYTRRMLESGQSGNWPVMLKRAAHEFSRLGYTRQETVNILERLYQFKHFCLSRDKFETYVKRGFDKAPDSSQNQRFFKQVNQGDKHGN